MSHEMEVKHEETKILIVLLKNSALLLGCLLLVEDIGFQAAIAIYIILLSLKETL